MIISINFLIFSVGFINGFDNNIETILKLILISNLYIFCFALIFFFINKYSNASSSAAFKMISIWLLLCVIIPGSVHQYVNYKYPANYMVDFLDVNRKQTYDVFKLENSELFDMLYEIHPSISKEKDLEDLTSNKQNIRRSISSIVNQMNINAAYEIEKQNEAKNNLIRSTYLFNPISFIQNTWNSYTNSDYYAYKDFRIKIQESINARNNLMVDDLWSGKKVDSETYKEYLKVLN